MSQPYMPSGSGGGGGGGYRAQIQPQTIPYLCADCGLASEIKMKEPIRCGDCGCRVMYKKRVKRMVQFEAR